MSVLPEDWALPAISDSNRTWFTGRKLAVQRCRACQTRQHPPEQICHRCGEMSFELDELGPNGTIYSYTVAHYAVNRALADSLPYAVVLVSLDDAPQVRVIGNLPGVPVEDIRIGMEVEAFWEQHTAEDGTVIELPQWRRR